MKNHHAIFTALIATTFITSVPLVRAEGSDTTAKTPAPPAKANSTTIAQANAGAKVNAAAKARAAADAKARAKADAEEAASARFVADKLKKFMSLYQGGQADLTAGKYADAEKKLLEAVGLSEGLSDNELQLKVLVFLGDAYLKQKKFKEAEKYYKQSYDNNVSLYRGNYPVILDAAKGLSEVYTATGKAKQAAKILSDAKSTRASRYSVAGVDNADLFAAYYQSLRDVLAKNNTAEAVRMFKYPVTVRWNGSNAKTSATRTYRTEPELAKNLSGIFSPKILSLLAETPEKDLWCRDQGIMVGGGLLWLTDVELGKANSKPVYQIHAMTINDNAPPRK